MKKIDTKLASYRNDPCQYSCDKCDKVFTQIGTRNRHIRGVHEGVKFTFNLCRYEASYSGDLASRKKRKH